MPLARYFGFVGTALLILLLGVSWLVSEPVPEAASNDINKPVIRISSIEKLPERVIFDTSLPPNSATKRCHGCRTARAIGI